MSKLIKRVAKGFTLIELMIVVAIIGILAAIAIPKFADLITKSKESAIKGSLGTVRSAVSIYYSDNEGVNPVSDLGGTLSAGGKYLDEFPFARLPKNSSSVPVPTNEHKNTAGIRMNTVFLDTDTSSWFYNSGAGKIAINCSHTDTKSSTWSQW